MDPAATSAVSSALGPLGFLAVVGILSVLAWMFRSFCEHNPDPLLLNLTFFAFAGQWTWTIEHLVAGHARRLLLLFALIELVLAVLQATVFRQQVRRTKRHYHSLIGANRTESIVAQYQRWPDVMVSITGVDFYPELYDGLSDLFEEQPREERRNLAISILPSELHDITADMLKVPVRDRRRLWQIYLGICALCWIGFLISVLLH